jgi:hypothetical protein
VQGISEWDQGDGGRQEESRDEERGEKREGGREEREREGEKTVQKQAKMASAVSRQEQGVGEREGCRVGRESANESDARSMAVGCTHTSPQNSKHTPPGPPLRRPPNCKLMPLLALAAPFAMGVCRWLGCCCTSDAICPVSR